MVIGSSAAGNIPIRAKVVPAGAHVSTRTWIN
jgi:hypothetical protein